MFPFLRKTARQWWRFRRWYGQGQAPWDSGIVPPEVVETVGNIEAGYALDIGCGTGTTSVYLAEIGWQVTGVDFVGKAIQQARAKASKAGVTDKTRFMVGDVSRLVQMEHAAPYTLAVDIGCSHALPPELRADYVNGLADVMAVGGLLLSYMHYPREGSQSGLTPDDVKPLYETRFEVEQVNVGDDTPSQRPSAWYWMRRK